MSVALLIALLGLAEIGMRIAGERPWAVFERDFQIEPPGSFYRPHPTLGYVHLPGRFTITLERGHRWTATHGPDALRITHPPRVENGDAAPRRQLWIFGCSFTHGWSVDDEQTYPWLLQAALPDWEVVNFGVGGYGTVHALIQLREALQQGRKPDLVMLGYLDIHDDRNVFSRRRRKAMVPWNRLGPIEVPAASLDDAGRLEIAMVPAEYAEFPLMRQSALVHRLEQAYNNFEILPWTAHLVTRALVAEIARVCGEQGAVLVVAGLRQPQLLLGWCGEQGIRAVDVALPTGARKYTNLPHDSHPGPLGQSTIADGLLAYLRAERLVE